MDLTTVTFVGLITLGVVNGLTMFAPTLDSRFKLIISIVVAFGLTFVPADIGNVILNHAKDALEVAFMASGAYKIAQKAGGN